MGTICLNLTTRPVVTLKPANLSWLKPSDIVAELRTLLVDKLRQMVPHQRAALPYRRRPVSRAAMGPSLRRDDKVDAILLATRLKRHSSPSADSAQPDFRRPVSNV